MLILEITACRWILVLSRASELRQNRPVSLTAHPTLGITTILGNGWLAVESYSCPAGSTDNEAL
jgi:hypothetical protein